MARIVVGIDPSEASAEALRWAVEEARLRDATVVALHAWQLPPVPPAVDGLPVPPPVDVPGLIDEFRGAAEALVERIVSEVVGPTAEVEVERSVVEDAPASALIDAARGAELLVVGSRGHGGFTGLLLGSVSLQCAQHAPCPVVIHRRQAH